MKTKLSIPAWRLCTCYQRRKSILKKKTVYSEYVCMCVLWLMHVCMYVCSTTYACMYVTVWCTKSCDLLSWKIKEKNNNTLKCLVCCKVGETVKLGEFISECSVFEKQTDIFLSSMNMAPTEYPHLLLPKRLRKHSRRSLAKASGGMGSAETMAPTTPVPEERRSWQGGVPVSSHPRYALNKQLNYIAN